MERPAALKQSTMIVLLVGLLTAGVYGLAGGLDRLLVFPMDDAYIHFTYARNLAEHGRLTFNLNPPDDGVGTTSILWPLLLAALGKLVGVTAAARLLGVACYLAMGLATLRLARLGLPQGERHGAWSSAVLVMLSGNLVWFGMSGMETLLFLTLGLWIVVTYAERRFAAAGILGGLLLLTRIEGGGLLLVVALIELLNERRPRRELVLAAGLSFLLLLPWLLYLQVRTGEVMPTSFAGKKHAQVRAAASFVRETLDDDHVEEAELDDAAVPWWAQASIYPLGVIGYGVAFVAGGYYLPGPRVPLPGRLGIIDGLAVLGVVVVFGLFLPLVSGPLRQAVGLLRRPTELTATQRALVALGAWIAVHNLAYWVSLPTPGTASRYQVVNHFALWYLLGIGLWRLRAGSWQLPVGLGAVLLAAVLNAGFFARVYAADVEHMAEIRLGAAEWIDATLPPEAVVAAHDIGALGWRMNRKLIDLGGLIDPAFLNAAKVGQVAEFLQSEQAGYLVLPMARDDGRGGIFDYAVFLGLQDNVDAPYHRLRHFEQDYDAWLLGAAPTWNALPGVSIFRFEWETTGAR